MDVCRGGGGDERVSKLDRRKAFQPTSRIPSLHFDDVSVKQKKAEKKLPEEDLQTLAGVMDYFMFNLWNKLAALLLV